MNILTKEEVLKLAKLSKINITDEEVASLIEKINTLLSYTLTLKEVASQNEQGSLPHIKNIFREDEVISVDSQPLLELGPEVEDNYFVVPKIIKN